MRNSSPNHPTQPSFDNAGSMDFRARILRSLHEIGETILVAGLLFLAVNLLTARIRVEGTSMEPSLHNGEFVVISRLAYRWQDIQRGDIVVFNFPLDQDRRFIKRVIGLPGDQIEALENMIYVNNIPLNEPYLAAPPRYEGSWTVGEGQVFVLGDNRNNSSDSQNWGTLPVEEIIGKAVLVYWPLDDIGLIPHIKLVAAAEG